MFTYQCPNGARLRGHPRAIKQVLNRGKGAKTLNADLRSTLRMQEILPPNGVRGR